MSGSQHVIAKERKGDYLGKTVQVPFFNLSLSLVLVSCKS